MTDWIKHNGGPQPVADDVWVFVVDAFADVTYSQGPAGEADWDHARHYFVINQHLIDAARKEGLQKGLEAFDEARLAVEGDIQKLCDAARLEGIRLGLEAAAGEIGERQDLASNCPDGGSESLRTDHMLADLRALDPEIIAREAQGER